MIIRQLLSGMILQVAFLVKGWSPFFFCIVAWVPEISGRIILKQLNL
jgi:hypothetical protein